MKTNTQLRPVEPTEKPTGKKRMRQIVGRPYKKPQLNPPHFPVQLVDFHNPGLFWMGVKPYEKGWIK